MAINCIPEHGVIWEEGASTEGCGLPGQCQTPADAVLRSRPHLAKATKAAENHEANLCRRNVLWQVFNELVRQHNNKDSSEVSEDLFLVLLYTINKTFTITAYWDFFLMINTFIFTHFLKWDLMRRNFKLLSFFF